MVELVWQGRKYC